MKCLFLSLSSTTSATLWSAPIQNDSILFKKMAAAARGRTKLLGLLTASTPTKKPLPCFQSVSLPHPPSLSAECQVSLGLFFCLFRFVFIVSFSCRCYFKSCVSGSHCLCLTGRPDVLAFSKNHGHGHWLSC